VALQMTHFGIAALTKQGHWQLTDQDAKAFAQAGRNVARHYSIAATQKALDWYALILAIGSIEGVRVATSYKIARARRTSRAASTPAPGGGATVFHFKSPHPPAAPNPQPAADPQPTGGGVEGFTGDGVDAPLGGLPPIGGH
jgi:hypothetical protein